MWCHICSFPPATGREGGILLQTWANGAGTTATQLALGIRPNVPEHRRTGRRTRVTVRRPAGSRRTLPALWAHLGHRARPSRHLQIRVVARGTGAPRAVGRTTAATRRVGGASDTRTAGRERVLGTILGTTVVSRTRNSGCRGLRGQARRGLAAAPSLAIVTKTGHEATPVRVAAVPRSIAEAAHHLMISNLPCSVWCGPRVKTSRRRRADQA